MKNIIDLLDKKKMVDFGYVGEYGSCHTAYISDDLTLEDCQMLASEVDFEINKEVAKDNSGDMVYCIKDLQKGWDWVEDFVFRTPQLALQEISHVLLDIGIAVIPKEDVEELVVVEERLNNGTELWDIELCKKKIFGTKARVSIQDVGVLKGLTKDNIDDVINLMQKTKILINSIE